tara:strand:+ start:62 stop:946 length:885 start_codon:yes stop_codon:yes gene_type:complete
MTPSITVGIPTCKRPKLLKRALNSLITEKLNNLFITVSIDGKDNTYDEYKKIESFFSSFTNIKFYYHDNNIGSLNNFLFLRDKCTTKYFMWLADDDETNIRMINKLYLILENNINATTAVPYWELVNENNERKIIKSSSFEDENLLIRLLKYTYDSDDVFFYGLHKLKNLKNCNFSNYWWPNKNSLSNWCYVFQFDLIIQGKIILLNDSNLRWINHDYGPKYYPRSSTKKFIREFSYIIRRVNIYYFYFLKLLKWGKYLYAFYFIFIFFILFLRDVLFKEPTYKKIIFSNEKKN